MRPTQRALALLLGLGLAHVACTATIGAPDFGSTRVPGETTSGATTTSAFDGAGGTSGMSSATGGATTTPSGAAGTPTTTTTTSDSTSTSTSTSTTTDTDSLDAAAQHCVDEINKHRATQGLPPYQRWNAAESCSNDEAKSDGASGQAHGAFGSCGEMAQNECPGWPGTPYAILDGCLQMMWDEGPGDFYGGHGHYINMSSTQYTRVACGFAKAPDGSTWSVQNFQ